MFNGKLPQELTQKNAMYKNWFHNSFWCNLVKGVATGFIIRTTTIQYIHKRFLFFLKKKKQICSFAYNNRSHCCDSDFNSVVEIFKYDLNILQKWLNINSMKTNPKHFQFAVLGSRSRPNVNFAIGK